MQKPKLLLSAFQGVGYPQIRTETSVVGQGQLPLTGSKEEPYKSLHVRSKCVNDSDHSQKNSATKELSYKGFLSPERIQCIFPGQKSSAIKNF